MERLSSLQLVLKSKLAQLGEMEQALLAQKASVQEQTKEMEMLTGQIRALEATFVKHAR